MKLGVNLDVTNADYHSDVEFLSSSAFKLLHKDPQSFYRKYILKERETVSNQAALNFGTVAHLMLLEPHLMEESVAVFDGGPIKRGKAYDEFIRNNEGKIVLSLTEKQKLDALKAAFEAHPNGPQLLAGCEFEYTLCGEINGIKVKCRADAINIERGIIVDVKTTGYGGDKDAFGITLNDLYYDLSAALYCEIAKQVYGKPFDFYFIVLSKSDMTCSLFKTSRPTYNQGLMRLNEAIQILKECRLTNVWEHAMIDTEEDVNQIQEI